MRIQEDPQELEHLTPLLVVMNVGFKGRHRKHSEKKPYEYKTWRERRYSQLCCNAMHYHALEDRRADTKCRARAKRPAAILPAMP